MERELPPKVAVRGDKHKLHRGVLKLANSRIVGATWSLHAASDAQRADRPTYSHQRVQCARASAASIENVSNRANEPEVGP